MNKPAVAFFVFNRPDCTRIVFEEIRRYRPEQLFLVADGPRSTVPTDKNQCEAVREVMGTVDWDCDVKVNFADSNMGCRNRMSSGIDWVFSHVEEAIILEDDCVPCPDFFVFCAEMLAYYRDDPKIMHIGGSNFQAGKTHGNGSYYFSLYIHGWGWASWRRAWQHFDLHIRSWPQAKQGRWLSGIFKDSFTREYWNNIFDAVYTAKIPNSWDYQWLYACWRHGGLGITPNVNLVTNIGTGLDATHTKSDLATIPTGFMGKLRHPQQINVDQAADRFSFDEHFGGKQMRRARNPLIKITRLASKLKRLAKSVLPSS